jgi:hypothetical protein
MMFPNPLRQNFFSRFLIAFLAVSQVLGAALEPFPVVEKRAACSPLVVDLANDILTALDASAFCT